MRRSRTKPGVGLALYALAVALLLLAGPLEAQEQERVREGVETGELVPLEELLPVLRERFDGHKIGETLQQGPDGQLLYEVKWLTPGGRMLVIAIDARTGEILRVK